MLNIGAHMSIKDGYEKAGLDALSINANTFQFFTRNPRGGNAKELNFDDVNKLKILMEENNIKNILAHAPYTLNMASAKEETYAFAKQILRADLDILNQIPCNLYVIHPGSHTTDTLETGINKIADAINETLKEDDKATILLEGMSGKGSEVGRSFNDLKEIIDRIDLKEKIGVLVDTCHLFCAGYDIVNNLDGVLEEFDNTIGINRLKAVHLNDSMNDLGTNKDRHAVVGEGFIGLNPIINFVNNKYIKNLPMFLETPNELLGYKKEIEILKNNYKF